ncbi:MAG: hypothetical protein ACLQCB_19990 [Spirochaetia bacterium]
MRIENLASAIEARLVVPSGSGNPNIISVYGGHTMSDLIANAAPDVLLVTSLNNTQLIRVADLMDVPAICLVDGCEPAPELVSHARAAGTALLVSARGLERTSLKAAECLGREKARTP